MKKCLFLILFFLLYTITLKVHASPADTTVIKQLIEKADKLGEGDINLAFKLFDSAQVMARKIDQKQLLADALLTESYYYFSIGEYAKVVPKVQEAGKIYQSLKMLIEETKCHNSEGLAQMYLNRYSDALRSLFLTKSLTEKISDQKLIAAANNNIGLVYESLDDWDNALVYARKSLAAKLSLNDTIGLAKSYGNIANLYYYQKKYDSALAYFRMANSYSRLSGNPFQLAISYSDMGNLLADMGQLDSAIYYQCLALEIQAPLKEDRFVEWCHTVSSLGSAWLKKGNFKKAAFYLNKCKSCEGTISDITFLKGIYSFNSEYYTKTKDFVKASHYLHLLNAINDSIIAKSGKLENQRIAIRYEFDQKATEDSLQYQLRISQQEMATTSYRNKMYLLLVALLIITGIAVAIVRRVRAMQERRRRTELETMRHNIAGDLHDDIGSTLSSIQIISSLAANQCAGNLPLQQSIKQINKLSDKVASGMREIVWSVNPLNDNLEAIIMQLRKLAGDILGPAGIPFVFIKNLLEPETELLPQIRKDLILFFKEALNNARKYSNANQIDINIQQNDAGLEMEVRDYGCGFDMETVCKGNGLNSMQRRADEMKATLSICTKKGEGTKITLLLPLP